jgi:hypothetical protein
MLIALRRISCTASGPSEITTTSLAAGSACFSLSWSAASTA